MVIHVPKNYRHFIESNDETWDAQKSIVDSLEKFHPRKIELFLPNEYYGLDLIVKKFIDQDQKAPLKFGLPHGVELGDATFGNVYGFRTNLSTLTYNNAIGLRNIIFHKVRGRRILAEHPFLILIDMMTSLGLLANKKKRNATLFFPAHRDSTHDFINKNYDEEICMRLVLLRPKEGEIDISLPLLDIELGRHQIYEDFGFNVVTSGHRNDGKFLSRFANLVTSYSQIASTEIGSHMIYTAALGCAPVFWDFGMPSVQQADTDQSIADPYLIDPTMNLLFQPGKRLDISHSRSLLGSNGSPIRRDFWHYLQESSIRRDRYSFIELEGNTKKLTLPQSIRRPIVKIIKSGFTINSSKK